MLLLLGCSSVRVTPPCCASSVVEVSADGALSPSLLPPAALIGRVPSSGPDTERVSTGTKYALDLWLRGLDTSKPPQL